MLRLRALAAALLARTAPRTSQAQCNDARLSNRQPIARALDCCVSCSSSPSGARSARYHSSSAAATTARRARQVAVPSASCLVWCLGLRSALALYYGLCANRLCSRHGARTPGLRMHWPCGLACSRKQSYCWGTSRCAVVTQPRPLGRADKMHPSIFLPASLHLSTPLLTRRLSW